MQKKITVIGAGSWGTALAISLAKNNHQITVWDVDKEHLKEMAEKRQNIKYLEGIDLPENISVAMEIDDALKEADIVLFSAPAQKFRNALETAHPFIKKDMIIVNVAKGIEQGSLLRLSQIAEEKLDMTNYTVLSGPSHAEEVARNLPTTVVVAAKDKKLARYIQDIFMSDFLRVYTTDDICGVELGGALKNIIALGAGISDGMGFGDNAKAALMTRGITEMVRFGMSQGARFETFAGLSGIGDLIVTCTSMHSRNRRCGILIGKGMTPKEAQKEIKMVVEGMFTTVAAYDLSQKAGVEMPITTHIYDVINEKMDARDAVLSLMTRKKKGETEDLI